MKITDAYIDEIYDSLDVLAKNGNFEFIDMLLDGMDTSIQSFHVDILLTYATATLSFKSKLKKREKFIGDCKRLYPEKDLWKGLE